MNNRSSESRFFASLLCVCILVVGGVGWSVWERRHVSLDRASFAMENAARQLAQHAGNAISTIDLTLQFARNVYQGDGENARRALQIHRFLRERSAASPEIDALAITDGTGRILYESGNHPPRGQRLSLGPDLAVLSGPVSGDGLGIAAPATADGPITLRRPILRHDGAVSGFVIATLGTESSRRFAASTDVGPGGVLAIVAQDGRTLIRMVASNLPGNEADILLPMDQIGSETTGSFETRSPDGNAVRMNGYSRVGATSLFAIVSMDKQHALSAWNSDASRNALFGFIILAAIAVFGLLLWWQIGRRQSAEGREREARGDLEHKHAVIETILRTLPDGVCLLDPNLNIAACNDQLFRVLGLERRDILGRRDSGAAFRRALADCAGEDSPLVSVPTTDGSSRDGVPARDQLSDGRWVESRHTPLTAGGFLSVYRDVSDQTRRETQLQRAYGNAEDNSRRLAAIAQELYSARAAAEQANLTKSRFLANMSHELRTPLNAIIGFSEMIAGLHLGRGAIDRYQDYGRDILVSGEHLLELINGILDLSKIEAGRMELRSETIDLAATVNTAIKMVEAAAEAKDILLTLESPNRPILLKADGHKLVQSFLNVLSNAVKFTPAGGHVSAVVMVEISGPVIAIRDTGIGIDAADMGKVFEPFAQIDSDIARKVAGTGLGMPLTRSLIELHDGTIHIDSTRDVGTSVTIRLPRRRLVSPQPVARTA